MTSTRLRTAAHHASDGEDDVHDPGRVWIITAGSYSDYRILCAFSSRQRAQEYIDVMSSAISPPFGLDAEIEEYALDRPMATFFKKIRDGWRIRSVHMRLSTGDEAWCDSEIVPETEDETLTLETTSMTTDEKWPAPPRHVCFGFQSWAPSKEAAIKIANERRIQYLAAHPAALEEAAKQEEAWRLEAEAHERWLA